MKKWFICLLVLCLLPVCAWAGESDYLGVWRGGQSSMGSTLEYVFEFKEGGSASCEILLDGFSLGSGDVKWTIQDNQLIVYETSVDEVTRMVLIERDGLLHMYDAAGTDLEMALGREGTDAFGTTTEIAPPDTSANANAGTADASDGSGMTAATQNLPLCLSLTVAHTQSDVFLDEGGMCYVFTYDEDDQCTGIMNMTWSVQPDDTVLLSAGALGTMTITRQGETSYDFETQGQHMTGRQRAVPELYTALLKNDDWHYSQLAGVTFADTEGNTITFNEDGSFLAQAASRHADYAFEYLTELDGSFADWRGRVLFYDEHSNCLYILDDTLYIPTDGKPMTFAMRKDVYEGQLTDTIAWAFSDGVLTITGSGEIPDYEEKPRKGDPVLTPWFFFRDQVTRIEVGEGITRIGNEAFAQTGCTSVSLPSTLKSLGDEAFYWTQLDTLVLPEGLEVIGHGCFQGSTIREIVIPDTVTDMEGWAFAYCKLLENVQLSGSQKVLRTTTFYMCNSLKELYLPASISEVENCAIWDCPFLEKIYYANPSIKFDKNATKDSKRAQKILVE